MFDIDDDLEQNTDCIFTENEFKDLAKSYLSLFFKKKVDEDGFEICPEDLFTDRNVSMVLNFDICRGIPFIYDALKSSDLYKGAKNRKGSKIPEDVKFILELLNECSKMSIPKNFASGLIAVYIETCVGVKLDV